MRLELFEEFAGVAGLAALPVDSLVDDAEHGGFGCCAGRGHIAFRLRWRGIFAFRQLSGVVRGFFKPCGSYYVGGVIA